MAIIPNSKKTFGGMINPFWIEPSAKDMMGYKVTGVAAGDVIPQGTALKANDADKTAVICKYAVVEAVAADKKTLTVRKGHFMTASTKVAISGAETLVQLNLSSVEDAKIVLSAAHNTIKAGDVLVEVATTDGTVAPVNVPNRIVADHAHISELDATVNAVHSGVVVKNIINYPAEYLNATTFPGSTLLVGCPLILFVKQ